MSIGLEKEDKAMALTDLTKAFDLFNQKNIHLEKAYKNLKKEFKNVNLQLHDKNNELKDTIKELHHMTLYLNNLLSHMSQGIIFVNTSGFMITFNQAARNILGHLYSQIQHKNFWDLFSDDIFGFSMKEALSRQIPTPIKECKHLTSSGDEKILEIETSIMHESQGRPEGLMLLVKDVTKLRQLQKVIQRQDRLKELGEMAASVAHEIRNPLGGIEGFASLLARDLSHKPRLKKMAQSIVEGTRILNQLISNVLHYAKPIDLQCEPIELWTFIEDIISMIKHDKKFIQNKINFNLEQNGSVQVFIDPAAMRRALLNLFINAQEAMPKGGTITVSLKQEKHNILFILKDEGVGIPSNNIEKIFSPFFTTKIKGSGVGLSEVHKIIQAHEGDIEVSSHADKGTQFIIRLPRVNIVK